MNCSESGVLTGRKAPELAKFNHFVPNPDGGSGKHMALFVSVMLDGASFAHVRSTLVLTYGVKLTQSVKLQLGK